MNSDRDRRAAMLELVCATSAELLGWEPSAVDPDKAYSDYGYNSMAAVELTRLLTAATGIELPLTLLFDHPTPTAVADHLLATTQDAEPATEPETEPVRQREPSDDEPLAIVGMACRYPGGVTTPDQLWELVAVGRDAVTGFPTDRGWDLDTLFDDDLDNPATSHARAGGFLDDVAGFDADFFGVGPREATAMDPQQRLLLETAWEAVENAGIDPTTLRGTQTGVVVGISTQDYAWLARDGSADLAGYWGIGTATSVASGRIAYKLGLEGPVLTVDTACSSSLVALHLAGQALRREECTMALVGGAAVLATPSLFVEFSRQGGLAPDGRCKSFAAGADGTGWAEGAGMLVVERLRDARERGHRVLAVVRGSAVNSDGASNGLTAPNGPAQQRVIRQALADAGLEPSDVDAVEAHGTGTTLGDPIEAQAIIATYGQDRAADRPLWLGSLKSNIGHAQAAAGVGGIIKMVQAMRHGVLPRTLHVDEPSPKVNWSAGSVSLLTEPRRWERVGTPRRAAVSALGIGGTNAHVILEEPPAEPAVAPPAPAGPVAWPLSARSAEALRAAADALHHHLSTVPDLTPATIGHALATRRARFEHRAVVVGETATALLDALTELAQGTNPAAGARGVAGRPGRFAVLFTGQGSQRPGAGRELARRYPVFATALREACHELNPHLDHPLDTVMFAEPGTPRAELLHQTRYTQPALFALEVALYRLVESWGLAPDYLLGHSVGELVAAHVSGVLSLADACALVAARGALMQALPAGGAMVAVEAVEGELELPAGVSVAAVNGPSAVVLSGEREAVSAVAEELAGRGRRTKRLQVSHAFHSSLMEPMLAALREVADGLDYRTPTIPVVSNLTGRIAGAELSTPEYWVRHVREAVRFHDGIRALADAGTGVYLELGPTPALTAMARTSLSAGAVTASALRAGRPEAESLLSAVGELHVHGVEPNWPSVLGIPTDAPGDTVELPTYPFQRDRFWVDIDPTAGPTATQPPTTPTQAPTHRPLLDMVRAEVGVVLGHQDGERVDPDRSLFDQGVDSIGGAELQRRLAAVVDADLPPTLLLDHTTPAAVAKAIGELTAADTKTPEAPPRARGTLTELVRHAHASGDLPAVVPVLAAASRFRPVFTAQDRQAATSVLVSTGAPEPVLVCLPSFLAGSGPHQFARVAAALPHRRRASALTLPGFGADPRLPDAWATAVASLADAASRESAGAPCVLVGYSIGGVLAHAVAAQLAESGTAPAGVVLVDTFEPDVEQRAATFGWAMGQIIERDHDYVVLDDDSVLAMGGYLRLFDQWRTARPHVPSLLLRAERTDAGQANWRTWQGADEVVDVPGDHFSVLEGDAATTAAALDAWLSR